MRRGLQVAVLAIGMTGCASVDGLRKDAPDVSVTSSKAPAVVGACIANGWGEFYGVSVNQAETPAGGYTVNMPSMQGNNGVADIAPVGSGSKIDVRYRLSSMGGYGRFTDVVKGCS